MTKYLESVNANQAIIISINCQLIKKLVVDDFAYEQMSNFKRLNLGILHANESNQMHFRDIIDFKDVFLTKPVTKVCVVHDDYSDDPY